MTIALILGATRSTADPYFAMLEAYAELKTGTLYKKYAQSNPRESAAVDAYWNGSGPRPDAKTATGRALVMWADVHGGF